MSEISKVGAVILAAGTSSRFGKPKQLALFRGQSLLHHAAAAATSAGCDPVLVVVGEGAAEIEAALAGLACEVVVNPGWQEGIASSIRIGLQHLATADHDIDAILLLACDQPLVDGKSLREMIHLHEATSKTIVASAYAETLGIPALFERSCFPALLELTGDRGAKELILSRPDDVASFEFPNAAVDIDTPTDHERLS